MTLQQILDLIQNHTNPVILLEGRRKVLVDDQPKLTKVAHYLAEQFPDVIFRTGNADGSDTLFARGVAKVDPTRIQYVVPYETMRKENRIEGADILSLDQIDKVEEETVSYLTSKQSKKTASLVDYAKKNPKGQAAAKSKYLLRDTLKVTGLESANYAKPVAALFYINPADKYIGGTGHTIKVCQELNVPVFTQLEWEKLIR